MKSYERQEWFEAAFPPRALYRLAWAYKIGARGWSIVGFYISDVGNGRVIDGFQMGDVLKVIGIVLYSLCFALFRS
jgi:hypothetical protein